MGLETLVLFLVGLFSSALAAALHSLATHLFKFRKREETSSDRIRRYTKALREASELARKIEEEINNRSALADKLQADIDRANQLIELKKPEVEAVAQLLRGELAIESRKSFFKSFIPNFVFFALGVIVTLLVQ